MSDAAWLVVGFGIVWAVIALYLLRISLVQRAIERRIATLRPRDRNGSPPPRAE